MRTPGCGAALVACTSVVPLCVSHALLFGCIDDCGAIDDGAIDGASEPRFERPEPMIVAFGLCVRAIAGGVCVDGGVASGIFVGRSVGGPPCGVPPSTTVESTGPRFGDTPITVLRAAA